MTAADRHPDRSDLQRPKQLFHPLCRRMVGFINVQIHRKAMTISQAKQSLQLLIHGWPKHRWFQYTAQQPTAHSETPSHRFRLSARPKGKGRKGN
jgi:hypothetical protein